MGAHEKIIQDRIDLSSLCTAVELRAHHVPTSLSHRFRLTRILHQAQHAPRQRHTISRLYENPRAGVLNYVSDHPVDSQQHGTSCSHVVENFVRISCPEEWDVP